MILLEVPPKLIIYKSDIFITICQCEKCICNELLHYAYTYYTSSLTLCILEEIHFSYVSLNNFAAQKWLCLGPTPLNEIFSYKFEVEIVMPHNL